jgi:hypothetical protein
MFYCFSKILIIYSILTFGVTKIITEFTYLLTYLLIPRSKALLEKLTGSQLVKNFPAFYGTEVSFPRLQVPATCPYPEPDQSSPCPPFYFLQIHLNIFLPLSSTWPLSLSFPH